MPRPRVRFTYHEDLLIQAALEWQAGDFRPDAMPTPETLTRRNLAWRQQVIDMHRYIAWAEKEFDNPQMQAGVENPLKDAP